MARHKDGNWQLEPGGPRGELSRDQVVIAVLMDIRDEMKALNAKVEKNRLLLQRIDNKLRRKRRK